MSQHTLIRCEGGCGAEYDVLDAPRRPDYYTMKFSLLPAGWLEASVQRRGEPSEYTSTVSGDFCSFTCFYDVLLDMQAAVQKATV